MPFHEPKRRNDHDNIDEGTPGRSDVTTEYKILLRNGSPSPPSSSSSALTSSSSSTQYRQQQQQQAEIDAAKRPVVVAKSGGKGEGQLYKQHQPQQIDVEAGKPLAKGGGGGGRGGEQVYTQQQEKEIEARKAVAKGGGSDQIYRQHEPQNHYVPTTYIRIAEDEEEGGEEEEEDEEEGRLSKCLTTASIGEEPYGSDYEEESNHAPPASKHPTRRLLVLCACTLVGFVMNVMVSVVAPFFPQEAKRLTGTTNTVIGLIFAIFPLTNLMICPIINIAIRRLGRKSILLLGLLVLAFSTIGFGLSRTIPLWCLCRVLQGAGSAACGATYYAILSDMYHSNLGFVIGVQEAVTGLGYMIGPVLGAALYSLGGFKVPFLVLGLCPLVVCLFLPPLLREAHNFDPNCQLPDPTSPRYVPPSSSVLNSSLSDEEVGLRSMTPPLDDYTSLLSRSPSSTSIASTYSSASSSSASTDTIPHWEPSWRQVISFPFIYVALGTSLATMGFAFVEPVLSEHLMNSLGVSTSLSGLLMGIPSITYIVAAPLGGWLGEVLGYRVILFTGFVIFSIGLALIGPVPIIFPAEFSSSLMWTLQILALAMMGIGSAFGTITTMPDLKHIAGPGTTDLVASLFSNVCVPAGEVLGPLIGGALTQALGFRWASFYFGSGLALYAVVLIVMRCNGVMPWTHHKEDTAEAYVHARKLARTVSEEEEADYMIDGMNGNSSTLGSIQCSYASFPSPPHSDSEHVVVLQQQQERRRGRRGRRRGSVFQNEEEEQEGCRGKGVYVGVEEDMKKEEVERRKGRRRRKERSLVLAKGGRRKGEEKGGGLSFSSMQVMQGVVNDEGDTDEEDGASSESLVLLMQNRSRKGGGSEGVSTPLLSPSSAGSSEKQQQRSIYSSYRTVQ